MWRRLLPFPVNILESEKTDLICWLWVSVSSSSFVCHMANIDPRAPPSCQPRSRRHLVKPPQPPTQRADPTAPLPFPLWCWHWRMLPTPSIVSIIKAIILTSVSYHCVQCCWCSSTSCCLRALLTFLPGTRPCHNITSCCCCLLIYLCRKLLTLYFLHSFAVVLASFWVQTTSPPYNVSASPMRWTTNTIPAW